MESFSTQLKQFFSPIKPLWQAIVAFFKTTLGIIVGILILLCIITRCMGMMYHHKYMMHRGYERMGRHEMMNSRYETDDSMFGGIERQALEMKRAIKNNMQMIDRRMTDTPPVMLRADGTGSQQTISRMSMVDGQVQGYTISVQDNMIKGILQGDISDTVKAALNKENIAIEGSSFSITYTADMLEKIVNILDNNN